MIQKITRKDCLDKYSIFPLREYDKTLDEEKFYYPKIDSHYWLKIEAKTNIQLKKMIACEVVKLYKEMGIESLIFLCDVKSTWITKLSKNRTDYKQLTEAISYLEANKIGARFNGGIVFEIKELNKFLQHLYILTKCDGSFSYYHFIDPKETTIGYIHYNGDVKFDTITKKSNNTFLQAIKTTAFIDINRINTNRI